MTLAWPPGGGGGIHDQLLAASDGLRCQCSSGLLGSIFSGIYGGTHLIIYLLSPIPGEQAGCHLLDDVGSLSLVSGLSVLHILSVCIRDSVLHFVFASQPSVYKLSTQSFARLSYLHGSLDLGVVLLCILFTGSAAFS